MRRVTLYNFYKMNYLVYILVLFTGFNLGNSPEPSVRLLPESWLSIEGSSNFKDFSLRYNFEEYAEKLDLAISSSQNQLTIHPYQLKLPIRDFKCNNFFLKRDFRETLKYKTQPDIFINVDSLQFRDVDRDQKGTIQTLVQIGGVKKEETIHYQIIENRDGILNMKGKISIDMADFQLEYNQKFLGFIEVKQQVDIAFLFNFVVNP